MYSISIPHGTIKTNLKVARNNVSREFQFHMVRLRHATGLTGSAMSLFQFHMVRLRHVLTGLGGLFSLFQFHMVRLRHEDVKEHDRFINISIPHDTIKTLRRTTSRAMPRRFQFHMVRLRLNILIK